MPRSLTVLALPKVRVVVVASRRAAVREAAVLATDLAVGAGGHWDESASARSGGTGPCSVSPIVVRPVLPGG